MFNTGHFEISSKGLRKVPGISLNDYIDIIIFLAQKEISDKSANNICRHTDLIAHYSKETKHCNYIWFKAGFNEVYNLGGL